jgi:hypothetical protein
MNSVKSALMDKIRAERALSDDLQTAIGAAIDEFKTGFLA